MFESCYGSDCTFAHTTLGLMLTLDPYIDEDWARKADFRNCADTKHMQIGKWYLR